MRSPENVVELPSRLAGARRAFLLRRAAVVAAQALPPALALVALMYRFGGRHAAVISAACALAVLGTLIYRCSRTYSPGWLLRRLNAAVPAFEDSIELGLSDRSLASSQALPLTGLQHLQRMRIRQRLLEAPLPDLPMPFPWRAGTIAWAAAAVLALLALLGPAPWRNWPSTPLVKNRSPTATAAEGSLHVEPPAYTRLPSRDVSSLDAKVPAGSTIEFTVRLGSQPAAAALQFHDGVRIALRRDGNTWRGRRALQSSILYRLQLGDAPPDAAEPLHRIEVIPDRAPEIVVHAPQHSLTLLSADQKSWDLNFEATDDYGLGPADLLITLAQGSGENIKSTERTLRLEGSGDARHRVYRKTLDLAGLGFATGDDLIVRLRVSDSHPAPPNRTDSASFILRWPAQPETASEGMEGLVQKTLPAYFSSERQLIIDTEALIAVRESLEPKRFAARADDLGVQQKVLRLRYGQFLGEEFESNAEHAPPGHGNSTQGQAALKDIPPEEAAPNHASTHFGDSGNTASEYGHVHDKPEAATLLDPDTRRLLKLALDEMWQSELQLRQAHLEQALPYEYKALEYIKQVQQAERIYLARAGVQLPQVDTSRRLSGDRTGLADREGTLPSAAFGDAATNDVWRALNTGDAPDWAAFNRWTAQHRDALPDALGLVSAADRAQHDPRCLPCRAELERYLWPLLPQPPSALLPRAEPDAAGTAYLDALSERPASTPP